MSAVTASFAPHTTVRRRHALVAPVPAMHRSERVATGGRRLPARYTVPVGVLPRRLAGPRTRSRGAMFARRRVGAVAFVIALVLSVGSVAQRGLADRGGGPASAAAFGRTTPTRYVVQPGDTLWGIAARLYPAADQAEMVDVLVVMNGGAAIQAGQTLDLP